MGDYPWRLQIAFTALLSLVLFLGYLPVSATWAMIGAICVVAGSAALFWRTMRYRKSIRELAPYLAVLAVKLDALPERLRRRLTVTLVTGDATAPLFAEHEHVTVTAQSIWIAVPDSSQLAFMIDSLTSRWPEMAGRMGILLTLTPEKQLNQAALNSYLYSFRQHWVDAKKAAGYYLPGYLAVSCHLSHTALTPLNWFKFTEQYPHLHLLDDNYTSLAQWCKSVNHANDDTKQNWHEDRQNRQHLAFMLTELQHWVEQHVIPVLKDNQQPIAGWQPRGVVLLPVATEAAADNIWQNYLHKITTLSLTAQPAVARYPLPERLVADMPTRSPLSGRTRAVCHSIMLTSLFFIIATLSSAFNNQRFIEDIVIDIERYQKIPATNDPQRVVALQILKDHRQQLDDYRRHNEPIRLGLGFYQGQQMANELDIVIAGYQPPPPIVKQPPPPPPPEMPKTVTLDAISLFNPGQSALKKEATKLLVDALINIKAKPGWLILISGHTDSTGQMEKNRQLSLARAAAVRDWMIATSDIPERCFAIQGQGSTQPIADNTTAEGRAINRRVEISLVPDSSACQ